MPSIYLHKSPNVNAVPIVSPLGPKHLIKPIHKKGDSSIFVNKEQLTNINPTMFSRVTNYRSVPKIRKPTKTKAKDVEYNEKLNVDNVLKTENGEEKVEKLENLERQTLKCKFNTEKINNNYIPNLNKGINSNLPNNKCHASHKEVNNYSTLNNSSIKSLNFPINRSQIAPINSTPNANNSNLLVNNINNNLKDIKSNLTIPKEIINNKINSVL
jgi:hypothetical protein